VLLDHLVCHALDVVQVRQVGRVDVRLAAALANLLGHLLELLARARNQEDATAGVADLERGLEADPRRRAGDHDLPALDGVAQGAVAEERRVHVALPVVPQAAGVRGQRRDRDPGALERALRVARVESAEEVAVLDRALGDPEVLESLLPDPLDRRQLLEARAHRLRDRVREVAVDPHRELRRVPGLGEGVERLAHAHRLGIGQVEGVTGEIVVGEVGDVVHRLGDEVDRHHVRLAALGPRERKPLRQRLAEPLEQLEEVVRAVDLVHLTGLGVTEHDRRAEDQQLRLHLVAGDPLRVELRLVVGVWQLLVLVEHLLLPRALVGAGHGDRRDVVEAAHVVRVRELDDVPRAVHVRAPHRLVVRGHVVHGGEMEEVVDLLVEALDPQPGLREVARHRHDPVAGAQPLRERIELPARPFAHERVDGPLPLEQFLDEVPADETCCPGDEVVHRRATLPSRDLTRTPPQGDTALRQAAGWIVGEERATREALDCVASLRRGPLRPLAAGPPRWSRR
jgi:hypothetical protein